jgi:hypothetical protein
VSAGKALRRRPGGKGKRKVVINPRQKEAEERKKKQAKKQTNTREVNKL